MNVRLGDFLVAAGVLIFSAAFLLLGEFYWEYSNKVLLFPWLAGVLLAVNAIWVAVRAFITPENVLVAEGEHVGAAASAPGRLFERILWVGATVPAVYVLGFPIGLTLYALAYTSYQRVPWWQRAVACAVVFGFVYLGFHKILGVPFPVEPLWMRD